MARRSVQLSVCALSLLISFCLAQTQPCTPPPLGMVAWYSADGNANDFFGNNNGTLQNGATFTSGEVGTAFSLNGTSAFVSLPANFIPYPANGEVSVAPMSVDA